MSFVPATGNGIDLGQIMGPMITLIMMVMIMRMMTKMVEEV